MLWFKRQPMRAWSLSGRVLGPEERRAFLDIDWAETWKSFEASEATGMISKLNSAPTPGSPGFVPAVRLLFVKTEHGRSDFTSPPGESPARFADFSTQSIPIEILD